MVRSPSVASKPPSAAFQSHPSDLELVNTYLRPRVESGLEAPFIHESDVYASDPADLIRKFAPAVAQDGERAWYFFTPLRQKSVHGKRKARTVATPGGGCWHNEAKSKPVCTFINGKRQIGHRQSFSFVKKEGSQRVRTGWLMMELRLLKNGAGLEAQGESALGNLVLCKVYRSPRNPEPKVEAATASDDDKSSDATTEDDDDGSHALVATAAASGPKKKADDGYSSEATVAAPSRRSKSEDEISGATAAGRKEKAVGDEDSAETSAAAPAHKRKARDDESSGAAADAAPAPKRKAYASSPPGAPASAEMQCPHCGTHLVLTVKRAEPQSETETAKDEPAPGASDVPQGGSSKKNVRFHHFL